MADDERQALELVKLLLGYLPQNNNEDPPQVAPYDPADRMDDDLNTLIPDDEAEAYDVRDILAHVFDRDSFLPPSKCSRRTGSRARSRAAC